MAIKQEQDLTPQERSICLKAVSALQRGNGGYTIQLMQTLLKKHPEFLFGRQLLRKAGIMQSTVHTGSFKKIFYSLFFMFKIRIQKNASVILENLEKWLEKDPYNKEANWLLHATALACNMPETAAFALKTLVEGHPKEIKGMHQLAEYYVHQNDPQKALEIYAKILELVPTDLVAIQASKDAAAQASMQGGGWDQEGITYRDLIKS